MLSHVMDNYSSYIQNQKKLRQNTIEAYKSDMVQFSDYLKGISIEKLHDVNNTHVIRYLLKLQKAGKSTSTISRHLASIRCLFEYLINNGMIKEDPTLNLKAPRKEKRAPQILSEKEIAKLLSLPDKTTEKGARDKALLEVLYASGIRVSEINALNIGDIDLFNSSIKLSQNNSQREVPIGKMALESLHNYLHVYRNNADETEPLFINYTGERITRQGLWKILKNYSREVSDSKAVTPQVLRNSFAVHLLSRGADIKIVQEILGHSDAASTQAYTYLAQQGNLKEAYNKAHPRA